MGAFDEILEAVPEEDREGFNEKYPHIRESVEALETQQGQLQEEVDKWSTWRKDYWDEEAQATKHELNLRNLVSEKDRQLEELRRGAETEMTLEETAKFMKEQWDQLQDGVATKEYVDNKVQDAGTVDKEYVTNEANRIAVGNEVLFAKVSPLLFSHKDEFGEVLDVQGLFNHMRENQVFDPEDAYNKMVAERRQKLSEERTAAEEEAQKKALEEAEQRGFEKARQEAAMRPGGQIPTDQQGPAPNLGHLQKSKLEHAKTGDGEGDQPAPKNVDLGAGQLAHLGYEELVKSRQAGGTQ